MKNTSPKESIEKHARLKICIIVLTGDLRRHEAICEICSLEKTQFFRLHSFELLENLFVNQALAQKNIAA